MACFLQLPINTFWFFNPGFNEGDGITLIFYGKFIIQDFELCADFPDSASVHHHQVVKTGSIFDELLRIGSVQPLCCIFCFHDCLFIPPASGLIVQPWEVTYMAVSYPYYKAKGKNYQFFYCKSVFVRV